jgi:hypothetical protein
MATVKKSAPVSTSRSTEINGGKKAAPSGNTLMKKGGMVKSTMKKGWMKKGGKC